MIRVQVAADGGLPGSRYAGAGIVLGWWAVAMLVLNTMIFLLYGGTWIEFAMWTPFLLIGQVGSLAFFLWLVATTVDRFPRHAAAKDGCAYLHLGLAIVLHTPERTRRFPRREARAEVADGWWHLRLPELDLSFPDEALDRPSRRWLARHAR